MKKKIINSFKDIKLIIKNKLDVYDEENSLVPYKIFLDFTLSDILTNVFNKYTYEI